jgi:hypothetical protein
MDEVGCDATMPIWNRLRGAWIAWQAGGNEMGEPTWNGSGFIATLNVRSRRLELVDARRDADVDLEAGPPCRHASAAMMTLMPGNAPVGPRRDVRIQGPRPR